MKTINWAQVENWPMLDIIYWKNIEIQNQVQLILPMLNHEYIKIQKIWGNDQQDSNEFMTEFLSILSEDLNKVDKIIFRIKRKIR